MLSINSSQRVLCLLGFFGDYLEEGGECFFPEAVVFMLFTF